MKNLLLIILSLLLFFSLTNCSSTKLVTPKCLSKSEKNIIIRWGELNKINSSDVYYELGTDCKIYLYVKNNNSDAKKQYIGQISAEKYCQLISKSKESILKAQALNVPSDVSDYYEFVNDNMGIRFRAVWNPEFTNKGNQDFKALYNLFQESVKEAK
jgi:hypothetical protein